MEVSTMSTRTATKVVATHNTSEALYPKYRSRRPFFTSAKFGNGDLLAELVLGSRINANLTQMTHRRNAMLSEVTAHGLVHLVLLLMVPKPS